MKDRKNGQFTEVTEKILKNQVLTKEELLLITSYSSSKLFKIAKLLDKRDNTQEKKPITYSKNVFVPLVNLCRNECTYCGFRKDPNDPQARLMKPQEVLKLVQQSARLGCKEVLFTFGERPEERYSKVRHALKQIGNYNSTHEYHLNLCEKILDQHSLLPHSNPGILSFDELKALKEVNASMGLMLENASERLLLPGMPHEKSPGKAPQARLELIENAGKLKIPFTTGLLIGIGETWEERIHSLFEIKKLHSKYQHIQEIIIQNFVHNEATINNPSFNPPALQEMVAMIILTRIIFGSRMHVQVPPNLNQDRLPDLLSAGLHDWGGISPISKDHVNPEHEWPEIRKLRKITEANECVLIERLPIYPDFITPEFTSERVMEKILIHIDESGFVR
ncbi:MAG: 7,8-didemethyl-8-hydroxy-5-deazariboflavin synthase CofG [Candidatus Helarchaeota archaeon]